MKRIVIADDEMYILHILAIKLRNAGFQVFTAGDGEEALQLCIAETPDLIITDYQMPYRNGLDVCAAYRQYVRRNVPAMLITAREHDIPPDVVAEVGIEAIIAKPFSPREVVQTVQRLLNLPPHTHKRGAA